MNNINKLIVFSKKYLPMFFLLCFSGNPIVTHENYSKTLLVGYSLLFLIYTLITVELKILKKIPGILSGLLLFIFILIFFQRIVLGFVSYPGVLRLILSIILGLTTILFYQYNKIDFIDTYIKTLAFLAFITIPFLVLNQFGNYGLAIESRTIKSLIIYTSNTTQPDMTIVRNSGMFWEPGAFAGYLILALIFIALKNGKFQIGPYRKEVFWILIALFTTMSTTGFIALGIIMMIYSLQNYHIANIIVIPIFILFISIAYYNLDFLQKKIEKQFADAAEMDENEVSASRAGALKMDLQYIKSQPIIGNGLHIKTRFRFHPQVKGDIGHGNGMSNFIACWGIPFFLFWLFCVYKFLRNVSRSSLTALISLFIIILLLQGEPYLNFPLFLSFFCLPFIYQNILSVKNKTHFINENLMFIKDVMIKIK